MAESLLKMRVAGCRHRLSWPRARLHAVLFGCLLALGLDALTQISVNFLTGGDGFYITAAQAKKASRQHRREDSGDDRDDAHGAQSRNSGVNSGDDDRSNSDDRSSGSTRNAESSAQGAARTPGSAPQAVSTGPPTTVAEGLKRLFKWMQPEPQAIPPWPEAKVTRAATGERAPAVAREKLAPKAQAAKRPATSTAPGTIVLPQPGTFRPNELLVLDANAEALGVLHARGWRETASATNGVLRMVSETDTALVAREQLQARFPETRLGLNFIYALANDSLPPRAIDAKADAQSCPPERCYGPRLIDWRADLAACAAGVKIGVIDTAVDASHPALAWKKLTVHHAAHQVAGEQLDWHGTGVVSLLAGSPKSGTPGLVPEAHYVIANIFFKNTSGQSETDTVRLLWGLGILEQHGAQVVNMSLSGPRDELVHQRLIELSRKGTIFVAAAGNGGPTAPAAYPAAYKDQVIAVTAVDRSQRVYDHANRGDYIDVAAPGVRIWTALPNNKEGAVSGTSFAAPFVTAIVAAIYKHTLFPEMSTTNPPRAPETIILALPVDPETCAR